MTPTSLSSFQDSTKENWAQRALAFALPILGSLSILLSVGGAHAAPITIAFTGVIDPFSGFDTSTGPLAHISPPFASGDLLSGTLTYDAATVGVPSSSPLSDEVNFSGAVTGLTLTLGSFSASYDAGSSSVLTSDPNSQSITDALFTGTVTDLAAPQLGSSESERFSLRLDYPSGALLDGYPGLPTEFPSLAALQSATWSLAFVGTDFTTIDLRTGTSSISGSFTSFAIVPEPGTAIMLGLGLVLLAQHRPLWASQTSADSAS